MSPFFQSKVAIISIPSILVMLVLFTFGMPKFSGDIQSLYPRHSDTLDALNNLKSTFGDNFIDFVIVPIPAELTDEIREEFISFEESILELPGIKSIQSPLKAYQSIALPIRLLNTNRTWARFFIEIDTNLSESEYSEIHNNIERLRPKNSLRSGSFYASQVATNSLQQENRRTAPLCFLAVLTLLTIWTRRISDAIKILLPSLLSLGILCSILSIFGIPLGSISQLVPPLLFAIGTSYSSFLAGRLFSAKTSSEALLGAKSSLTLASLTTAIGFLSLLLMNSRGVDDFAIIMTGGTVLSAFLAWSLVPRLISPRGGIITDRKFVFSKLFTAALTVLLLFLATGLFKMKVDTVPMDFFPKSSMELKSMLEAEEHFSGSHILNLHLTFTESIGLEELEYLSAIEALLRKLPGVANVTGTPDFNKFYQELEGKELTESSLTEPFGPPAITSLDKHSSRVIIETDLEGGNLLSLAKSVREVLKQKSYKNSLAQVSSKELLIAEQSEVLTHGLLESVFLTLLLVWLLFLLCFRNLKLASIALLPSILPVLGIFGAMGFCLDSVDLGAAIVASSSLGMISDFSFHVLMLWRKLGQDQIEEAINISARPFFLTGTTLVLGFCPTIFSSVSPVRSFGILMGSVIFLGILLNLSLLPWLVSRVYRSRHLESQR